MPIWENRLQSQVDEVLYKWMKEKSKASTAPADGECISILKLNGIYNISSRPGKPMRDDLRKARGNSGISDSEKFIYYTKHLKFDQERKYAEWIILLR